MKTPELFDAYVVMSPAFWWDKEILTKQVKTFLTEHHDLKKKLYFGISVNDGYGMRQELKRFVDEIKNAENNKLSWLYKEFENEGHMSAPACSGHSNLNAFIYLYPSSYVIFSIRLCTQSKKRTLANKLNTSRQVLSC